MTEVDVVRSALRNAAKSLDANIQTFVGTGSLSDIQSRGAVNAQHLGNWDAGQSLARTVDQAHQQLTQAYSHFMDQYREAISALLMTAAEYDGAEEANLKRLHALFGTDTGPSGS